MLFRSYAGMLMFSKDCWITRVLPDYFLDYRQETSTDTRWEDRFTSFTGDWSGNIYDFYIKVYNKPRVEGRGPRVGLQGQRRKLMDNHGASPCASTRPRTSHLVRSRAPRQMLARKGHKG